MDGDLKLTSLYTAVFQHSSHNCHFQTHIFCTYRVLVSTTDADSGSVTNDHVRSMSMSISVIQLLLEQEPTQQKNYSFEQAGYCRGASSIGSTSYNGNNFKRSRCNRSSYVIQNNLLIAINGNISCVHRHILESIWG